MTTVPALKSILASTFVSLMRSTIHFSPSESLRPRRFERSLRYMLAVVDETRWEGMAVVDLDLLHVNSLIDLAI